jgi:hypothetical protein
MYRYRIPLRGNHLRHVPSEDLVRRLPYHDDQTFQPSHPTPIFPVASLPPETIPRGEGAYGIAYQSVGCFGHTTITPLLTSTSEILEAAWPSQTARLKTFYGFTATRFAPFLLRTKSLVLRPSTRWLGY